MVSDTTGIFCLLPKFCGTDCGVLLRFGCVLFGTVFGFEAVEDCAADFVSAFFGCCFMVALGLEPTDPGAVECACVFLFAVFGAEEFDARLPFDAADVLFLCFLIIYASFPECFARTVPCNFFENATQRVLRALSVRAAADDAEML